MAAIGDDLDPSKSRRSLCSSGLSWSLLVAAVAAGAVALLAQANLFPLMSGDSDEPVYRYQARMIAEGHATLAARVHAEFFYPWLFGQRGSRLFSQYQPGWPAVIAVAHLLGDERGALVVAAAAAVVATWFLAREVAPGSGGFAAALLLLSPIFVVQAGLYLSYLWTTALVAGALACVVAGVRTRKRVPFGASGALFGLALLTRPFDAFIAAVVAGGYILVAFLRDGQWLRRSIGWSAAGGLPFVVLTALYNAHVTGSPTRFPLQAAEGLDTFGFGTRTMALHQPSIHYTPHVALSAFGRSVASMPHWFAGAGLGLLLALAAVVRHRRRREVWMLLSVTAVFPVAYVFWWATALAVPGVAKGLGPHYYIPAFGALAVLGGWALHDVALRSRVLAGLGLAAVAGGSLFMAPTVLHNAHVTTQLQRAKAIPLTTSRLNNAVVVMRADPASYTLLDFPFLVGDPHLDDRVLYAIDRGPASAQLAARFPSRTLYQFVQRAEPGDSILRPSYVVEPMRVVAGRTVTLSFEATNTEGHPFVVASVKIHGRTVASQMLARVSHSGATERFRVELGVPGASVPRSRPGLLVARVASDEQVRIDVDFGSDSRPDRGDVFERRYFVMRSGNGLAVQTPGLQYHRFDLGHVVWVSQSVAGHLAEQP